MVDYPRPVTKRGTQKILEQMTNSIYAINEKYGKFELGCFTYIRYKNRKVPVVIISNNLLDIEFNNIIKIWFNNEIGTNELGKTRYNDKETDISIIEIKENELNIINYMEIDDKLYKNESEMYYDKESIYIIKFDKIKAK